MAAALYLPAYLEPTFGSPAVMARLVVYGVIRFVVYQEFARFAPAASPTVASLA